MESCKIIVGRKYWIEYGYGAEKAKCIAADAAGNRFVFRFWYPFWPSGIRSVKAAAAVIMEAS